jgi:hypothetical protein
VILDLLGRDQRRDPAVAPAVTMTLTTIAATIAFIPNLPGSKVGPPGAPRSRPAAVESLSATATRRAMTRSYRVELVEVPSGVLTSAVPTAATTFRRWSAFWKIPYERPSRSTFLRSGAGRLDSKTSRVFLRRPARICARPS